MAIKLSGRERPTCQAGKPSVPHWMMSAAWIAALSVGKLRAGLASSTFNTYSVR